MPIRRKRNITTDLNADRGPSHIPIAKLKLKDIVELRPNTQCTIHRVSNDSAAFIRVGFFYIKEDGSRGYSTSTMHGKRLVRLYS
jgi:hypothetical protein